MIPVPVIIGFLVGVGWHGDNIKRFLSRQVNRAVQERPQEEDLLRATEKEWHHIAELACNLRLPGNIRKLAREEKIA